MFFEDTIAAMATPPGQGGIGIIRISGDRALNIAKEVFSFAGRKTQSFKDRYLNYGWIKDDEGRVIDEALVVYMKAPRSYTTEDVVEIQCHGGVISQNNILKQVIKKGARLAEPGEFTKRAFLNGRVDLIQAEAIMDLISARTEKSAQVSMRQMSGGLSKEIKAMRERLLQIMARIEVTIDYPEEDIDEFGVRALEDEVKDIVNGIEDLLMTADEGRIIREGIKVVIAGKTNVGKSSLLNALTKDERAIVTDIPGTTRDVIEEFINIKGIAVKIIDTAGIRETLDPIEKIGIERSKRNMDDADLIIVVLDASSPLEPEDIEILRAIGDRKSLILLNKIDKPRFISREELAGHLSRENSVVDTSIILGKGIDKVRDMIYKMFFKGEIEISQEEMVTNIRHQEALQKSREHLLGALDGVFDQIPIDIVSIDLRGAIDSLGHITGETIAEDLIHKIFSEFCLGK